MVFDEKDKLLKYSPKYNEILKKVNEVKGLSFIYTEWDVEGIATLEVGFKSKWICTIFITTW